MNETPQSNEAVKVFYSYSHKDEKLRDTLEEHLSLLNRQGVISEWHDRGIGAGREWAGDINEHLKSADIILLLVSASLIASDYCYDVELKLAMERHEAGAARVVPVILQPCDWTTAPFGKLQALPKNGKPVTKWRNRAEAFTGIANGIRRVAEELNTERRASGMPAANTLTKNLQTPAASLIPRPPSIGFVARRDEQGNDIFVLLKNALAPDKSQLVAVSGPGGTGKTTLAAEVARSLRGDYGQRLAWVSALGRTDFGLPALLDDIATQLGRADLRRLAPDPKAEQVRALLADSPSLVVLDNFETIEPGEQSRCAAFLAESTECSALITTRSRVNRPDVRNVRLAAMEMDDARELWRRLVEQSGRPSAFVGLVADEIIRHCEANPLVIQWVVGQIELAQRPHDALAYLSEGKGDAAERVFDRSFNLPQLGDDGRAALLALSLFTPDASRQSLAEVAGFGDDLDRLNEAVGKMSALWLVETTDGNERLFLRALKYEMAKSQLSKDSRAVEFRRRLIAHFLRFANAHVQPTPEDLEALEAEKDNVLGSANAAFDMQEWVSVMSVSEAIHNFLFLRGHWNDAVRSSEQAEAAAREITDDFNIARFMANTAKIRRNRGESEEARRIYREALGSFRRLGSERNISACLHSLGMIARKQGDLDEAHQLCAESLEIERKLNHQEGIAVSLHELGNIAYVSGNVKQARKLYAESLEIEKSVENISSVALSLHQLAMLAEEEDEMEEAQRLYTQSLEIKKSLGNQKGIANTLGRLGMLAERRGNKAEAVRLYREALNIFETLGSPEGEYARIFLARLEGKP